MLKDTIEQRIEEFVTTEFPDVFIVEVKLEDGKRTLLSLKIDTDRGISLAECHKIGREIGHFLEDEALLPEPYHLEVSSPGVGHPLKLHRQYVRNIGRNLEVLTTDGSIWKGILKEVEAAHLTLGPLSMKGKKKGKKKPKPSIAEDTIVPFEHIKEAKVFI
ncbi:MAG: ribosome maturation factor RimP [Bacteroidota bacterium]